MSERLVKDLRPHGIAAVPMLGRYQYRHAHRGLAVHSHPGALEICYLAQGQQLYRVAQRDYVLRGGDVFVTFPDETHSTGESPEEKGTLYWIIVQLAKLPEPELRRQLAALPHRHFPGTPGMQRLLDEMLALTQRPDRLRRVRLENRLTAFLLEVLTCSRRPPHSTVSPVISALLRYIETNVHQTLPLPALAARLELSLPRFKARFKAEVGIPPADYVLRCKIAAAKQRLVKPGATVTGVALELNFASSQYFATVFRRYSGQSPQQFRAGFTA